jgi:hypothetical protein
VLVGSDQDLKFKKGFGVRSTFFTESSPSGIEIPAQELLKVVYDLDSNFKRGFGDLDMDIDFRSWPGRERNGSNA